MATVLRRMTPDDVGEAVELWNADYVHDPVGPARLELIVFGDPHGDPDGRLAAVTGGALAGFVCCVAPSVAWMPPHAFLKGLCARSYGPGGAADDLLGAAEQFAARCGKEGVHVVEYAAAGYFFPGIPFEYPDKIEFFVRHGYRQGRELHDVDVGLGDFTPTAQQQAAFQKAAAEGIEILPYGPAMLDMMKGMVDALQMPYWFPPGWEAHYSSARNTFVAVQKGKMLGYANYQPNAERGDFGTTAVLAELRGRGIGSCLLVASMLRMKELGTPRVWAHWANTPFYLKNGWRICRRYATFHKTLAG